jgi:hypothetical protein
MSSRKITFHVIKFIEKGTSDRIHNDFNFEDFITWFATVNLEDKIFNLTSNRFTSMDTIEKVNLRTIENHPNVYFGMMSTGIFGSRRNLKSILDNSRRENPKELHEGEEQENYFVLGFKTNGDIDVILQNAGGGIKSNHLKNYLDKFITMYLNSIGLEKRFKIIEGAVISTPDRMIDRLDRVIKTKIFIDKSILGEDELNLARRTLQAKEDIIIDIRAQRGKDIRDLLQDLRQSIVYNTKVEKLWIEGKDSHNNLSHFFLNNIQKSTFVTIDIDPNTAALVSDSIKRELLNLL